MKVGGLYGRRLGAWVAIPLLIALSSCSRSPEDAAIKAVEKTLIDFRPPAQPQLQPMTGEVIDALARDMPELAAHRAEVVAREQALLAQAAQALAAIRAEPGAPPPVRVGLAPPLPSQTARQWDVLSVLLPVAHAQTGDGGGGGTAPMTGFSSAYLLGGAAGAGRQPSESGGARKDFSGADGEKVSLAVEVAKDGVVDASISSNVDIPQLGAQAGGRTGVVTKTLCPDAEGRVEFTVSLRRGGEAGAAGFSSDQKARVNLVVDDNAEVISTDIHLSYDAQRTGPKGQARVAASMRYIIDGDRNHRSEDYKFTHASGDYDQLRDETLQGTLTLANTAILGARAHWQLGGCIRIDAASPGNVAPGAVSGIDVRTLSKADSSEVRAKVTATLEGGASLDPTHFIAPGKITHTAVGEKGKTMLIRLKATSRRGAATEMLRVTTNPEQYAIEGGGGQFKGTGVVCDLSQPFTVKGNANIVVKFTPSSDRGGSYTYTGQIAGSRLFGQGTYTVRYDGEQPVGIDAGGSGSATSPYGTFTNSGKEKYTLQHTSLQECT